MEALVGPLGRALAGELPLGLLVLCESASVRVCECASVRVRECARRLGRLEWLEWVRGRVGRWSQVHTGKQPIRKQETSQRKEHTHQGLLYNAGEARRVQQQDECGLPTWRFTGNTPAVYGNDPGRFSRRIQRSISPWSWKRGSATLGRYRTIGRLSKITTVE